MSWPTTKQLPLVLLALIRLPRVLLFSFSPHFVCKAHVPMMFYVVIHQLSSYHPCSHTVARSQWLFIWSSLIIWHGQSQVPCPILISCTNHAYLTMCVFFHHVSVKRHNGFLIVANGEKYMPKCALLFVLWSLYDLLV